MLLSYVKKDGLLKDQVCADILHLAELYGDKQPQTAGQALELHLDPGITKGDCLVVVPLAAKHLQHNSLTHTTPLAHRAAVLPGLPALLHD